MGGVAPSWPRHREHGPASVGAIADHQEGFLVRFQSERSLAFSFRDR